jgi:hypothetical protein
MKFNFDNPFREDTHTSMMRVCQFICVITAAIISIIGAEAVSYAIKNQVALQYIAGIAAGIAGMITAILVPAFGGKAIQSFSESTVTPNNTTVAKEE